MRDKRVKLGGIQPSQHRCVGIGQIDDDRVEAGGWTPFRGAQPVHRVVDDDLDARVVQRTAVGVTQGGARQFDDRGVEFDLHDLLDAGLAQQFARGQAVTATEHQHRACAVTEGGVDQAFGVAVFVAGGELQTAVEVEAGVVVAAGDDDLLIRRMPVGDDRVRVQPLPTGRLDVVRTHQQGGQQRERRGQRA